MFDIHDDEIEKTPAFETDVEMRFISKMAKAKQKVVSLLNIVNILTQEELSNLSSHAKNVGE